jgi:hypothetical protein
MDFNKNLKEFKTTIYIILKYTFNNCTICLLVSISNKFFNSEFHTIRAYDFNNNSQKILNNGHKIQNIIKKAPYLLITDFCCFNYFLFTQICVYFKKFHNCRYLESIY